MPRLKKHISFFLLMVWITLPLNSQTTFLDSLTQLLPTATFSESVALKYKTGKYLEQVVIPENKLKAALKYQQLAAQIEDSLHLEYAYWQLSRAYSIIGDTANVRINSEKQIAIGANYGWSLGDFDPAETVELNSIRFFLKIYKDTLGTANFSTLRHQDHLFKFNKGRLSFDTSNVHWVKFKLRGNQIEDDHFLFQISSDYAGQRSWEYIDAWIIRADSLLEKQQSGIALPMSEKTTPYPVNLLNINIGKYETVEVYLRLEGVVANRIPTHITTYIASKDYYMDINGGYSFNGTFPRQSTYVPFTANAIHHHELVEDATKEMTIESIANNWEQLNRQDVFSIQPETDKVYWLKAQFYGNQYFSGSQVFHIAPQIGDDLSSFDYVDIYIPDKKGGFQHQQTGDAVPLSERHHYFWASFFELNLSPTDTVSLYARLDGVDRYFKMPFIKLWHVDQKSIWLNQIYKALAAGLFYGMLILQILFFSLLYFTERERIHLFFILFVLGLLLHYGFNPINNYGFMIFPFWKGYHIHLSFLGIFFLFYGLLNFIIHYFNYAKSSVLVKWVIPIFAFLFAFFLFLPFINFNITQNVIYNFLPNLFFPFGLSLSVYLIYKGKKQRNISRRYFAIALLPFILIFAVNGFIQSVVPHLFDSRSPFLNYLNANSLWITDFFEKGTKFSIIFMLIALALISGNRTNQLKAARKFALEENLANQKSINQSISRFVPNEFLTALGKNNISEVGLGDYTQKEVTILFSDIRSYTTLAEQMTPKENFQFVNAFNGRMGPVIQLNGGFVNQYLGDGIMAIFPNTTNDALQSAIQMQQTLRGYNQKRIDHDRQPIKMGVGLHSGQLIMGITGDHNRMDAATISDSVNTASRIENLTKYYGALILLSQVSLAKLPQPNDYHFRFLGQVQVKGKSQTIKIHECFDGDLPEQITLKTATLSDFNEGIKAYFNQAFDQAIHSFQQVLDKNPTDRTAKLFLDKAKWLFKTGVDANWTGVEVG